MQQAVYFLSDTHLSADHPEITACFTTTLRAISHHAQGVFILGDLFNRYLGDNQGEAFSADIATLIKECAQHCPIFFQRGNRDFLLARRFCAQSGMTLLPDRFVFFLDNQAIAIEHGDLLCTDDTGYQRLRKIVRHPAFIWLADKTPLYLNRLVGNLLRKKSANVQKSYPRIDVNEQTVARVLNDYHCHILIHGHTHQAGIHTHPTYTRYVLGDWHPNGQILKYEQGKFCLIDSNTLR